MSQITMKWRVMLVVALTLSTVIGCGTANQDSAFDVDTQQHAAGWLPDGHAAAAQISEESCAECHGADLSGGISGIACVSCHAFGVGLIHPSSWSSALLDHRDYVLGQGTATTCGTEYCHGTKFDGNTDSGVSTGHPSCTACHSQPYYNCTACHAYPPATGKHVFHVTNQSKVCADCHDLTWSNHNNGSVSLLSSLTYTAGSCSPGCHGPRTW